MTDYKCSQNIDTDHRTGENWHFINNSIKIHELTAKQKSRINRCFKLTTWHVGNECILQNTEGISDHSLKYDSQQLDSLHESLQQVSFKLKDEFKLKLITDHS